MCNLVSETENRQVPLLYLEQMQITIPTVIAAATKMATMTPMSSGRPKLKSDRKIPFK